MSDVLISALDEPYDSARQSEYAEILGCSAPTESELFSIYLLEGYDDCAPFDGLSGEGKFLAERHYWGEKLEEWKARKA